MLNHTAQIKQNNQIIMTLGDKHVSGYDNYLWWQLGRVVTALLNNKENNLKEAIKEIEKETDLVVLNETFEGEDILTIDLDNNTVDMPYFPLFRPEDVEPETCCISLKQKDGKYYAVYPDGEEYEMIEIKFEKINLLKAKKVSISEFMEVVKFVDEIIEKYNDTDFVLNNEYIIRFNFM